MSLFLNFFISNVVQEFEQRYAFNRRVPSYCGNIIIIFTYHCILHSIITYLSKVGITDPLG